jgi:hypothetical protein
MSLFWILCLLSVIFSGITYKEINDGLLGVLAAFFILLSLLITWGLLFHPDETDHRWVIVPIFTAAWAIWRITARTNSRRSRKPAALPEPRA